MVNKLMFNKFFIISIIILFSFLFCLNLLLPPQSDDFNAAISAKNGFKSAIESYMTWNGRIGELINVSFIAGINSYLFDFINAIVGTCFIICFFVLVFARLPRSYEDSVILSLILLIIMYSLPFGSTFFWGSGSLNYLWGLFFIVIFLLPYRFYYKSISLKNWGVRYSLIFYLPFLLCSFVAGMASEHIGFISILALVLITILYRKNTFPLWYVLGLALFIIGWFFLYFSPGHHIRASLQLLEGSYLSISSLLDLSFIDKIKRLWITLKGFKTLTFLLLSLFVWSIFSFSVIKNYVNKNITLLIYLLGVVVVIILNNNFWLANYFFMSAFFFSKAIKKDINYCVALFLLIMFLICAFIAIQIIYLPPRARLGDGLLLIAIFIILFARYCNNVIICRSVLVLSILYGGYVFSAFLNYRITWNNLVTYVESQKQIGNFDIAVDKSIFNSYYKQFSNWGNPNENPTSWPNPTYAELFGVKSFVVK